MKHSHSSITQCVKFHTPISFTRLQHFCGIIQRDGEHSNGGYQFQFEHVGASTAGGRPYMSYMRPVTNFHIIAKNFAL